MSHTCPKCLESDCCGAELSAALEAKEKEIADLKFRLQDWHDSAENAWKTPCPDERHCSCVPLLRKKLDDLEAELKEAEGAVSELMDAHSKLEAENADLKVRVEELETLLRDALPHIQCEYQDESNLITAIGETLGKSTLGASERLRKRVMRECAEEEDQIAKSMGARIAAYENTEISAETLAQWKAVRFHANYMAQKFIARAREEGK